jgi:hypothetical protein
LLVIVDYPEVMAFGFWLLIEEQLVLEGATLCNKDRYWLCLFAPASKKLVPASNKNSIPDSGHKSPNPGMKNRSLISRTGCFRIR